jgi:beta-galactosidase
VVDADGNLCPWAENSVNFSVEGAGRNAGVDNGSPISLERFKADSRKAFYGKALLIVQSNGEKGDISVKATSPELKSDEIKLTTY